MLAAIQPPSTTAGTWLLSSHFDIFACMLCGACMGFACMGVRGFLSSHFGIYALVLPHLTAGKSSKPERFLFR
jgi:hypothetical protein